ncbi:MAG: hypothetical protein DWQ02_23195 [Bacteroidetes bacterium]|nr:MAG: hypothetical protein DWQ02_23195 [Bacteroidota bacterium]
MKRSAKNLISCWLQVTGCWLLVAGCWLKNKKCYFLKIAFLISAHWYYSLVLPTGTNLLLNYLFNRPNIHSVSF